MVNSNISDYYNQIFQMAQHHNYSISELENLITYERGIYVDLLTQFIMEENKRIEEKMSK